MVDLTKKVDVKMVTKFNHDSCLRSLHLSYLNGDFSTVKMFTKSNFESYGKKNREV